ncbi:MAG: ATP-binding protein [bacterium]|nr:ATP-binding protein [bacterium]
MIVLDPKTSLILVIAFINFVLGAFVFIQNRKAAINQSFGIMTILVGSWAISAFLFRILPVGTISFSFAYILYDVAALLPTSFLLMTLLFPPFSMLSKKVFSFLIIETTAIIWLVNTPGAFIQDIIIRDTEKIITWGPYYLIYVLHLLLLFSAGYIVLIKKYIAATGIEKQQVKYIIFGTILPANGAMTTNLILPWFGIYDYYTWLGQVFMVFLVLFSGYAVVKHHLFNIKVIATELLTFIIWIFLLIRFVSSATLTDRIIDGTILTLTIVAGTFLIKSVIREVEQREKLEKMSIQLAVANDELKRVDEAKSEFLSIVSHQLRTPLTAIKGYISMMIEGSYGKLEEAQSTTLQKVFQSSERLIVLVNDLLNLNRIEDGRIIYTFAPVDMGQMIDDAIFDLKSMAENKGLKLAWIKPHGMPMAWADADKLRQVVINFIDNSIKYTATGSVTVGLRLENDYLVYSVKDTGVGMTPEGKARLFRKFERGEGGRLMYTEGTGLGLYVAKLMTEAHKGVIKGESEGKDKGSTFSITVPTEEYAKKNNINQKPIEPTKENK